MLYLIAAVLFFFAAVGVNIIPNPTAWGLFFVALGLALGGALSSIRPTPLPKINIGNKP